jgi:hypothetical protein
MSQLWSPWGLSLSLARRPPWRLRASTRAAPAQGVKQLDRMAARRQAIEQLGQFIGVLDVRPA